MLNRGSKQDVLTLTFEKRLEGGEGVSQVDMPWRNTAGRQAAYCSKP